MNLLTELKSRIAAKTPGWFKNIAWACGLLAFVGGCLWYAQAGEQINIPAKAFEWIKIITVALAAVAGVSSTAKDDGKAHKL